MEMFMIQKIYSVYDSKAECFLQPFYVKSRAEARRGFEEVANNKETPIGKWPSDYTLFELGSFDTDNARFDLLLTPVSLCLAQELVKS